MAGRIYMSREKAMEALMKGEKIAHIYFSDDEWLQLINGRVMAEDGVDFTGEGLRMRRGGRWEDQWFIRD